MRKFASVLLVSFGILILFAACQPTKIWLPTDTREYTDIADVPDIVDIPDILEDAIDGKTGTSYTVTAVDSFTRAAMPLADTTSYYIVEVTLRGYTASNGGTIEEGEVVYNFTVTATDVEYTAEATGLSVSSSDEVKAIDVTASGFKGSVAGILFDAASNTVSKTSDFTVTQNIYAGSYESGSDKVTNAENEGVVSSGNGEASSPFVISDIDTLMSINEFGNDNHFKLGADLKLPESLKITADNISLDLNNHSIDGTGSNSSIRIVGDSFEIKGKGTVISDTPYTLFLVAEYGSAVINGGTFISEKGNGVGVGSATAKDDKNVDYSGGTLIINNCNLVAQEYGVGAWGDGHLVINGGNFTARDNTVVGTNGTGYDTSVKPYAEYSIEINGGTFNANITTPGYISCGIYSANAGSVVLKGGTFNINGGVGILVRGGSLDLRNAVIINNHIEGLDEGKVGDSTVLVSDNPIVVDYSSEYPDWEGINIISTGDYEPVIKITEKR